MADENTSVQNLQPGVTVERAPGQNPVRKDTRGVLHMIHDELSKALGIGAAKDTRVGPNGTPLMDAVDDAVSGAKGANPDY